MKITPATLKGFRDFLPKEARKRQYIIDALKKVFESYGFEPIETPALEYAEILEGKYGEEGDRLMYKFRDKGDRDVALRYDQTVPLARVVSQYQNDIPLPFKRYQISNVWRGENPQAGRFREFLQCDIDTVGTTSLIADAEIIETAIASLKILGFEKFKVLVNDRSVFKNYFKTTFDPENKAPLIIRAFDKWEKIGEEGVKRELESFGLSENQIKELIEQISNTPTPNNVTEIFSLLKKLSISETYLKFSPRLARGLDYYTGTIFEIEIDGYNAGSVCGGGRYDNLIGTFSGTQIPAVGCAFGFDRIYEAMESLNLFPDLTKVPNVRVLVTVFNEELLTESIRLVNYIRQGGLNAELYDDPNAKMEKQIKYADKKGVMYAAIIGPEEAKNNTVTIKNLRIKDQQTISWEDMLKVI